MDKFRQSSGLTELVARKRRRLGFSFVEMLIVVSIIGILATVAIPIVLKARQRSLDEKARQSVRNVLSAQQAFYCSMTRFGTLDELATATPPLLDERFISGTGQLGNGLTVDLVLDGAGDGFTVTTSNPGGTLDFTADETMEITIL